MFQGRVPKPPGTDGEEHNTEFVPKPGDQPAEEPTILDEAGKEAS